VAFAHLPLQRAATFGSVSLSGFSTNRFDLTPVAPREKMPHASAASAGSTSIEYPPLMLSESERGQLKALTFLELATSTLADKDDSSTFGLPSTAIKGA
jgi:hypothetical protein